jgi:gamma-glutamylcyclotransferase (GGCT)/AIG2-like uncharacterized protein YtfP
VARGARPKRSAGWSTAQQAVVDRLFVYGTLRSGQAARSLVANYVSESRPATTRGRLYALGDGYPVLVPGVPGDVIGELLGLRQLVAALALLDAYEGHEFVRALIQVQVPDGPGAVWAWSYVLADPTTIDEAELIVSGDWARHLAGD